MRFGHARDEKTAAFRDHSIVLTEATHGRDGISTPAKTMGKRSNWRGPTRGPMIANRPAGVVGTRRRVGSCGVEILPVRGVPTGRPAAANRDRTAPDPLVEVHVVDCMIIGYGTFVAGFAPPRAFSKETTRVHHDIAGLVGNRGAWTRLARTALRVGLLARRL